MQGTAASSYGCADPVVQMAEDYRIFGDSTQDMHRVLDTLGQLTARIQAFSLELHSQPEAPEEGGGLPTTRGDAFDKDGERAAAEEGAETTAGGAGGEPPRETATDDGPSATGARRETA